MEGGPVHRRGAAGGRGRFLAGAARIHFDAMLPGAGEVHAQTGYEQRDDRRTEDPIVRSAGAGWEDYERRLDRVVPYKLTQGSSVCISLA